MACTYFDFWAAAHLEYLAFGETKPHPFVHINSYGSWTPGIERHANSVDRFHNDQVKPVS